MLADDDIRTAVEYLRAAGEPVASLDEVAEYVAGQRDEPSEECLERVAVTFHHVQLPKLAAAGVVDYDPRSHAIRYLGVAFLSDGPSEALEAVDVAESNS